MKTDRVTNKWLRAASYIVEDWETDYRHPQTTSCCDAIENAGLAREQVNAFENTFRDPDCMTYWWQDPSYSYEDQGARVLALCFMAAIEGYVEPEEPEPMYERNETNSKWLLAASVLREGNREGTSGCCDAMARANMTGLQERAFYKWFYNEAEAEGLYWWGYPNDNNGCDSQSARILALCFMDAIEQAGDL